jgi:hypothetical protein
MIKLSNLKEDNYWLSVIISLFFVPLIIFCIYGYSSNRLNGISYHILICSFVIAFIGNILTWLSYKREIKNGLKSKNLPNGLPNTSLIIIGSVSSIIILLITSPIWLNNFLLSLILICLSYIGIYVLYGLVIFYKLVKGNFEKFIDKDGHERILIIKDLINNYLTYSLIYNTDVFTISFKFVIEKILVILAKYIVKKIAKRRIQDRSIRIEPNKMDFDNRSVKNFALIFSTIFAIVAGVAITHSLEKFNEVLSNNSLNEFNINSTSLSQNRISEENILNPFLKLKFSLDIIHTLILISFFIIAIPFYHSAAIFLSNKDLLYGIQGELKTIIFHFIILFLEVILLFFMAMNVNVIYLPITSNNIGHIFQGNILFVFSLIMMMIAEVFWILIDPHLRKETIIPYRWAYVNLFTILFLFWFLVSFGDTDLKVISNQTILQYVIAYAALLCIFTLRTIINYFIGWNNIFIKGFEVRTGG